MNGRERLGWGSAHEQAVEGWLYARGLTVEPFGQALLSEALRDVLKGDENRSLLRWCWRPGKPRLFLVDAKHCIGAATPNHSIELRALLASRMTMLPVFYVCEDGKALSAASVLEDGDDGGCCPECWKLALDDIWGRALPERCPEHARRGRLGSGTPYALVRRDRCISLDRLFGTVISGDIA